MRTCTLQCRFTGNDDIMIKALLLACPIARDFAKQVNISAQGVIPIERPLSNDKKVIVFMCIEIAVFVMEEDEVV